MNNAATLGSTESPLQAALSRLRATMQEGGRHICTLRDRKPIFHPEKKTLVRLDNGEAVEVKSIEDSERQLKLNLETEANADAAPFTGDTSNEAPEGEGEPA